MRGMKTAKSYVREVDSSACNRRNYPTCGAFFRRRTHRKIDLLGQETEGPPSPIGRLNAVTPTIKGDT